MTTQYTVIVPSGEPFKISREELGYLLQRGIVLELKENPPRAEEASVAAIGRLKDTLSAMYSVPAEPGSVSARITRRG